MPDKIIVPTLGESVTEATVSKWLKNQGEKVSIDEPIVELETDKVNVEVPSPSNGVLESITVNEGETVNVGALLGMINGSTKQLTKSSNEVAIELNSSKISFLKSTDGRGEGVNAFVIKTSNKGEVLKRADEMNLLTEGEIMLGGVKMILED